MKLMCINNESLEQGEIAPLTIGKIYESEVFSPSAFPATRDYLITNDSGYKSWEYRQNFITLQEWREQQINKLI